MTKDEKTELFQELRERQEQQDVMARQIATVQAAVTGEPYGRRTYHGGRDAGGKGAYRFAFGASAFMQARIADMRLEEIEARLIADGYRNVYMDEWVKTAQENAPAKSSQEKAPEKGSSVFFGSSGRIDALMAESGDRRFFVLDGNGTIYRGEPFSLGGDVSRYSKEGTQAHDLFERYLTGKGGPLTNEEFKQAIAAVECLPAKGKGPAPIQHGPVTGKHAKKRRWG